MRTTMLRVALAGMVLLPGVALTQNRPDRERVDTTFTTAVDANFAGCTESVRVVGTLVTTIKAGESASGQVHNVTRARLTDVSAVGVTSGTEYKVQQMQTAQRSYEFGGAERHTAHAHERIRVIGPGPGNDFLVTVRWQYRQDRDGNVVVDDLQVESGCKK